MSQENDVKTRLEYLRGEIEAERISMGEIVELQSLVEYIEEGDVLLLEWAGVEEHPKEDKSLDHLIYDEKSPRP